MSNNMNHYVYVITNTINGKKYIGKRSCKCDIFKDKYMGSGVALRSAFKKYGIENFKKDIIKVFDNELEALVYEKLIILNRNACSSELYYNIAEGGVGGNCYKGKSDNEKSEIYKLRSNKISGENHWNFGKSMSAENRKMLSELWKGKRVGKLNPWSVKVVCLNTGEVFSCVSEAGKKYNVIPSNISRCCNKKDKCAGKIGKDKLVWMHYNEYVNMSKGDIEMIFSKMITRKDYRKVVLVNNLKIFESITSASDYIGLKSTSSIIECCQGKRKSAGKIDGEKAIWMYYDEYLKELSNEENTN